MGNAKAIDENSSVVIFLLLQKRLKRAKALAQSSSISNEEKRDFEQFMSVDYMSSEHSVSEDNTHGEEESSGDEDVCLT